MATEPGIQVEVSADGMAACLSFVCADGEAVGLPDIAAALADKGVISDFCDQDVIAATLAAGNADRVQVAAGVPAQDGCDAWLEPLIPKVRDRSPRVQKGDKVDFRDIGEVLVVQPDTPLIRRHPATPGVSGSKVSGAAIPAKPGKIIPMPVCLDGTGISRSNPDLLIATIAGHPVWQGEGVHVEPVYTVDEVNIRSGNIVFNGSVLVKGDVLAGMKIEASGDIEILGMVETVTLTAGGDIAIRGGAIGGKDVTATKLVCGGSFSANHVQQVSVEAGESIYINDVALQADLKAGNAIFVGKDKRGLVMGGTLRAVQLVRARVLGSQARMKTVVELGVAPGEHVQLRKLAEQRGIQEDLLMQVSRVLDLNAKTPGRLPAAMVEKARQTAAQAARQIEELRAHENAINRKIERALEAQVIFERECHEGVQIHLGELSCKGLDRGSGGGFRLVDGQLRMVAAEVAQPA